MLVWSAMFRNTIWSILKWTCALVRTSSLYFRSYIVPCVHNGLHDFVCTVSFLHGHLTPWIVCMWFWCSYQSESGFQCDISLPCALSLDYLRFRHLPTWSLGCVYLSWSFPRIIDSDWKSLKTWLPKEANKKGKVAGDDVTHSTKLDQRVWQWLWRRTHLRGNNSEKLAAISNLFADWK